MKNKKTMVLTIIAVVTLIGLIIGATYAYFASTNTAEGQTSFTINNPDMGTVIVNNPTENLYLKLSDLDMVESKKGKTYWATSNSELINNDTGAIYSSVSEYNSIANMKVVGADSNTNYNCTFNINITKPSEIKEGDMSITFVNDDEIKASIQGVTLGSEIDLYGASSQYTATFTANGSHTEGYDILSAAIKFKNTDQDQTYLAEKNLISSINVSDLSCKLTTYEEPDLFDGTLTAVVYDGDNWVIADTNETWYDYDNQEWANAVILASDVEKNVGDTISVDGENADVLAMYVWIPRYEYKVAEDDYTNGVTRTYSGDIDINFINKSITEPSEGYMVHPAFNFGGTQLSGIWVGKFEIGHTSLSSSTTSNNLGCSDGTCENSNGIRILPNIQSLRYNNLSNFYYGIKSMEQSGNVFGINGRYVDSHMMKNSEWGAVAYLTQSQYGKYGNEDFDYKGESNQHQVIYANKEVYINNSSEYYTGRSGGTYSGNVATSTYGTYTYDGYLLNENTKTTTRDMTKVASTTGNITGIYDMSGGSWDYVMSFFADSNGNIYTGKSSGSNSGFSGIEGTNNSMISGKSLPNSKYYDVYKAYNGTTYNSRIACNGGLCYGHAMEETETWYDDNYTVLIPTLPIYARGGANGNNVNIGINSMAKVTGNIANNVSTRSVLVSNGKVDSEKIYANGETIYYDVETGLKCTNYNEENSLSGYNGIDNKTGNQNSCLKFYAFNDDGRNTVNLLLDHNTTSATLWNSSGNNSEGPTDTLNQLKSDTSKWVGTLNPVNYTTGISGREYTINYTGYNARLITANEVAKISGYIGYNENKIGTAFYLDTYNASQSATCIEGNVTGCKYGWLYDRTATDCETEGCYNNTEVDISGYWTSSAVPEVSYQDAHVEQCNGYIVFGVSHHARLGKTCPNYADHYGVRPVIKVLKNNIK